MILELLGAAVIGAWVSILWRCDNCGYETKTRAKKGCPTEIECSKCGEIERVVA